MFSKAESLKHRLIGVTKPISLGAQVAASSTEIETYTFEADGVLQGKLIIRIYAGPELALRIYPKIVRKSDVEEHLIHYMGEKDYIDGDDDFFEWEIHKIVKRGDKLEVAATNANASYAYDYRLNCSVNYVGEA